MTNEKWRAEWRGRADFAEVAEALGVDTDQIMAVSSRGQAFWTDGEGDEDAGMYLSFLGRDAEGVLRASPPRKLCSLGEWYEQFRGKDEE